VWKSDHFGTNASDPSIAGDSADPDHDGLKNILEYALGSDPNLPTSNSLAGVIISNHFQLQFTRNTSATDMNYFAQAAPDLGGAWSNLVTFVPGGGWATNTPGSTVSESDPTGSPPNQRVQVIVTDPEDSTSPEAVNRFFQLKVQP
jgi:hypothetical protein